ncbi:tyrosine-type recombinase/integrase, partial [Rhizorhabdus sp.]|uniref:tyrosine-type recombinase/integrase n=1 Tax=Rhizorhabdus sp. TaxID=1968843 RepID=UPI0035ADB36B
MALLTDAKARKIDAGGKALADGGVPGLYLFPTAESGRGKWILRFVSPVTKKRRDMGLGRYPEVSIRDARDAALAARLVIRKGADPIEMRRVEEAAAQVEAVRVPTFETAARTVFAEVSRSFRNAKHKEQWIHTLEDFVFPRIGSLPVDELRAAQFADVLKPIWL